MRTRGMLFVTALVLGTFTFTAIAAAAPVKKKGPPMSSCRAAIQSGAFSLNNYAKSICTKLAIAADSCSKLSSAVISIGNRLGWACQKLLARFAQAAAVAKHSLNGAMALLRTAAGIGRAVTDGVGNVAKKIGSFFGLGK